MTSQLAAKEAEKIPMEVKIDCYVISMVPVKHAIEEHVKQLQEALIASLRRKTAAEKAEVEEFVKNGKDALEQQFNSIEEIGKARTHAKDMINQVGIACMFLPFAQDAILIVLTCRFLIF